MTLERLQVDLRRHRQRRRHHADVRRVENHLERLKKIKTWLKQINSQSCFFLLKTNLILLGIVYKRFFYSLETEKDPVEHIEQINFQTRS